MESNITYLTFREQEPLMASFGMNVKRVDRAESLRKVLRDLDNRNQEIIYVSNEVYKNNQTLIDGYNGDTLTLIVFESQDASRPQGARRMRNLLESSIGIKTR